MGRGIPAADRPRVLVVAGDYLPGYRSGGPVRSIAAWVERLGDDLDISVVCLDRDLGERTPYPDVPIHTWVRRGRCRVLYLPPRAFGFRRAHRLLRETRADIVYLNSLFTVSFAIAFVVAARLMHPLPKIVLAPRGQLSLGALGLKRRKKQLFLRVCFFTSLFRDVQWQASSESEADDIRRVVGADTPVTVARNLRLESEVSRPAGEKLPGHLRVICLSRIAPVKNLLFALDLLDELHGAVELAIAGPVDDQAYWDRCLQRMKRLPPNVRTKYFGSVPHEDVAPLLASHDLLLLPTLSENYGHVIVEALQVGTPVLISDQTPWRGLEQLGAGWDLPLGDFRAFAAALQRCIDIDDTEFTRLSCGAREAATRLTDYDAALQANRALFGLEPDDGKAPIHEAGRSRRVGHRSQQR